MPKKLPFLKVSGRKIIDEAGNPILLRGVALGGWLMMEGYMTGGQNMAEQTFRAEFKKALGRDALDDFVRSYRNTYITEYDIKTIKRWGANCIRIPFNYRLIEPENKSQGLNPEGLKYLDNAVKWCEKNSIYCILDMHAAPGSQNHDWHSDCAGKPKLFASKSNRDLYYRLWHLLSSHYKNISVIAGYDILNEPVVPIADEPGVKDLYVKATKEIRSVGDKHIIFLEGNLWAQRIKYLGKPSDLNTAYSIHVYPPLDFTFNFARDLRYPGKAEGEMWSKKKIEQMAKPYRAFIDRVKVPLYAGEFGVNARDGVYGENKWVKDVTDVFDKHDLHWTYWTYKTIANAVYPDGIYRYVKNPLWVNRQGPVSGWETFRSLWKKERNKIIDSWRTENFARNDKLLAVLKKYW